MIKKAKLLEVMVLKSKIIQQLKKIEENENILGQIDNIREVLANYQDHLKQTLFSALESDHRQHLKEYDFLMDCAMGNKDMLRINTLKKRKDEIVAAYQAWISPAMPPFYHYYSQQYRDDNAGEAIPKDPLDDVLLWSGYQAECEKGVKKMAHKRVIDLLGSDSYFCAGVEKLKIINAFIDTLDADAQLPNEIIKNFAAVYQNNKAKIETYRHDAQFKKALDWVLKVLKALTPLGLMGMPRLWKSAGEKTTKKVDTLLKKNAKPLARITPKTK